jgi:peptide deformylase
MLKIIKFPDTILRERMPEFDFSNPIMDPKELEKQMIETMFANNGIGLSACQVGIKTRVFVMGSAEFPDHAVGVFNPVILETDSGSTEDTEGCLSFPGIFANIKRPKAITAQWQNSSGETISSEVDGYTARCFLHEFDHLEGIVYQDRLSPLKWAMSVKKSKKDKRKY